MQEITSRSIYQALMAIVITGGLLFFATGDADWWLLLWLAPLATLLFAFHHGFGAGFIVAAIAYAAGNFAAGASFYYGSHFPIYTLAFGAIINGLAFGVCTVFACASLRRFGAWVSVLAFASSWVSYQFLWASMHHGNLTNLSVFSQMPATVFIQSLSVVGYFGVLFIIYSFSAGIAAAWMQRHHFNHCLKALLVPAILLLLSLSYGEIRLHEAPKVPETIRVGLAGSNPHSLAQFIHQRQVDPGANLPGYLSNINALAASGAQFILQPEKALTITPTTRSKTVQALSAAAKKHQVTLLAGVDLNLPGNPRNALMVFNPQGKLISQYNKMHLVYPFERHFIPGAKTAMLQANHTTFAIAICHDMDFIQPMHDYGAQDADIIFVPAEDFGVGHDARWHLQMAMMNSVANGLTLVRAAMFGYLSVVDAYGHVIVNTATVDGADVTVTAKAPLDHATSLFSQYPDYWAGIILLIAAVIALMLLWKRQ